MITEKDLASTNISMSYEISPIKNIIGDLSGLLGNFCDEFIGSFYSRNISKKSNIVTTELLNNAISNNIDGDSKIILEIKINKERLWIKVKNVAKREQFDRVRAHIEGINDSDDLRKLLADTIRQRRRDRERGGLGLIRLAAENKFSLSVDYDDPFIIVETQISLGGLS
ncbi:hypothetical protein ES703_21086 [subsurface metagenome]